MLTRTVWALWPLWALPAIAIASPIDEMELIHRAFLACGPARLDAQVNCTESAYRQYRHSGDELALFEDIVGEQVRGVLMGAAASAQASIDVSEILSIVEGLLRNGMSLQDARTAIAQQNAKLAQSNRDVEQAHRECLRAAMSATGGLGGPAAAMGLCSVPVH